MAEVYCAVINGGEQLRRALRAYRRIPDGPQAREGVEAANMPSRYFDTATVLRANSSTRRLNNAGRRAPYFQLEDEVRLKEWDATVVTEFGGVNRAHA